MNSLFYNHLGNFQWNSIAVALSLMVLIAQIVQFYVQQKTINKNKKIDMLIEFRMNNLKNVKKSLLMIIHLAMHKSKIKDMDMFHETNYKLSINLKASNHKYEMFNKDLGGFSTHLTVRNLTELNLKGSLEWAVKAKKSIGKLLNI